MSSIRKIEHRPEVRIRVRFTDLVQWCLIRINDLVNRISHPSVLNRPSKLARCFTSDGIVRSGRGGVARVGSPGRSGCGSRWREQLSYAEVSLRRWGQEVVDRILVKRFRVNLLARISRHREPEENSHSRCVCGRRFIYLSAQITRGS